MTRATLIRESNKEAPMAWWEKKSEIEMPRSELFPRLQDLFRPQASHALLWPSAVVSVHHSTDEIGTVDVENIAADMREDHEMQSCNQYRVGSPLCASNAQ